MKSPTFVHKNKIQNSTILVTGGAGFIGSHLVEHLLRQGAKQVVVVDDLTRSRNNWVKKWRKNDRILFVETDIANIGLLEILPNVAVVFHLAAISRVLDAENDPVRTYNVNVMGTVHVVEAARIAGIPRLVFTSSREVYGDIRRLPVSEDVHLKPKNIYGASKVAAELYLQAIKPHEIAIPILRITNVYGQGDQGRVIPTFVNNALKGLPLLIYGGKQIMDFIRVDKVIEILLIAGFSDVPILKPTNIGSGVGISIQTLAKRILDITGGGSKVRITSPRDPEVERFQADMQQAYHYFGLSMPKDPLDYLSEMLLENKIMSDTGISVENHSKRNNR